MNFEDLTPEQQEKAKACKTADELVEHAQVEGIELSDEELNSIAGGGWGHPCNDDTCGVPFGR